MERDEGGTVFERYAATLGKGITELTEAEKRPAWLDYVLDSADNDGDTGIDAILPPSGDYYTCPCCGLVSRWRNILIPLASEGLRALREAAWNKAVGELYELAGIETHVHED